MLEALYGPDRRIRSLKRSDPVWSLIQIGLGPDLDVFDPVFLISEAIKITTKNGSIIISVPLYFDLLDRLKILFTGSVISMDNLCYGKENYKKFKSYNYDHIRFFRPSEM